MVLLVKLFIDKRSDFAVRLAVLDCINESLKDLSEDQVSKAGTRERDCLLTFISLDQ